MIKSPICCNLEMWYSPICDKYICKQFWCTNTILLSNLINMKSCCGKSPVVWINNQWECSECGVPSSDMNSKSEQLDIFGYQSLNPSKSKQCDCGGDKAKTTHAFWCSKGNGA